ncbi:MAG: ABC transporter ATP-binding protein [Spirochaetaceae bacterium]|jgi:simple sugar transport system ATP-binding protein|nr:ABC transporter ATP-binding protein [Spirochaetaceae bacterium]
MMVEFRDINRYYPSTGVQANDHVSFSVSPGEIHAICGENGAGKSTLMNILFGLEKADSGEIRLEGAPVSFKSPSDAIARGIGMVHQHFKVVNSFTVTENILLGIEGTRRGFLDKKRELTFVRELSERYRLPIDPLATAGSLPVGLLQRLEILKMLARKVRILILDEPTAVLTPQEVDPFLRTLRQLTVEGQTIFFISHKLREVLDVADRITVMKKGRVVATRRAAETSVKDLAGMMVGREIIFRVEKGPARPGDPVLEVKNLSVKNKLGLEVLRDVSFTLRAGEILGIAGVSGNGQEALVSGICGLMPACSGTVRLQGADITGLDVRGRRNRGLAHVPEDRIHMGLNMETSVTENVILGLQRKEKFRSGILIKTAAWAAYAGEIIAGYSVYGASPDGPVAKLSGGNMQKIVLGREASSDPILLVVNQPTRGLDVGSIEFVHRMLIDHRDRGVAILLISVELEEIIALSDRVGVLFSGALQGELSGEAINERAIGLLMTRGQAGEEEAGEANHEA